MESAMLMGAGHKSLGRAAYDAIKRDVARCRLAPGAELTEGELATHYGFGKTPVRDALARLAQEGLVRVLPRRGYVVRPSIQARCHARSCLRWE